MKTKTTFRAVLVALLAIALSSCSSSRSYLRYQHQTRSGTWFFSRHDTVRQWRPYDKQLVNLFYVGAHKRKYGGVSYDADYVVLVLDSIDPTGNKQCLWYAHDLRGVTYDRVSEYTITKI